MQMGCDRSVSFHCSTSVSFAAAAMAEKYLNRSQNRNVHTEQHILNMLNHMEHDYAWNSDIWCKVFISFAHRPILKISVKWLDLEAVAGTMAVVLSYYSYISRYSCYITSSWA
jgi:hypothetical protein